jgi:hypothetical protein
MDSEDDGIAARGDGEQEGEAHRQGHRGREVLPDERVDAGRKAERAGVHHRAETAAERAEHVAAHADRGRHEDEEARQFLEGAGDRTEDQARDQTGRGRDQERDKTRANPGGVRAQQRDKARAGATRELQHFGLGGSDIPDTSGRKGTPVGCVAMAVDSSSVIGDAARSVVS